jgi:hypothetical protein
MNTMNGWYRQLAIKGATLPPLGNRSVQTRLLAHARSQVLWSAVLLLACPDNACLPVPESRAGTVSKRRLEATF